MGQLEDMYLFSRVVESGSITKAADQLNMAKSAISKRLAALEHKLGIKLIQRTTRKSSITEAGQHYYQRSKLILDEVEELNCQTASTQRALQGSLSLAAPLSFGLAHLAPALDLFLQEHPDLRLNVDFSDRKIDIIEQGKDLAFRIGYLEDSSFQARKIAPINTLLCASSEYLKKHGVPSTPEELAAHKILQYDAPTGNRLTLTAPDGIEHKLQLEPYMLANNGDFLMTMAKSHHGITLLPTFIAWQALATQALVPVMQGYQLPQMHAYAIYPANRHLPLKVRSLIDFLVNRFGSNPYWDQL